MLHRINEVNLINCDTFQSFATIDGILMESTIHPSNNINTVELGIKNSIKEAITED